VACRNDVPQTDLALDHPPVDAEGQVDLVLSANLAGEGNGLAVGLRFDRDRANRTWIGRTRDLLAAACNGRCDQDQRR
jgi:hypothetical protein